MHPRVRAVADRVTYDVGALKHCLALLDEATLDSPASATGWPMRATFGHVAESQDAYAETVERWLDPSRERVDERSDAERLRVELAARFAGASREEIDMRLSSSRDAFLLALRRPTAAQLERPAVDGRALIEVLEHWSWHPREHGLDILETAPALRLDPVIVTWALGEPFAGAALESRRRALVGAVRAAIEDAQKSKGKRK
jgi:hypothetical protein